MEGCHCKAGGASWLPFDGLFVHDKAVGRLYITYHECSGCHTVEATVVDRGHWDRLDFSAEYRWNPVLDAGTPYLFPNRVSAAMIKVYAHPAIFRWVHHDGSTIHIDETDNLCRYITRLVRPSSRQTRFSRLLHSALLLGGNISLETLDISPYRLGEITMHPIGGLRDRATRQFMWHMIVADARLRALKGHS